MPPERSTRSTRDTSVGGSSSAEALLVELADHPTTTGTDGYRWSRAVAHEVDLEYLRGNPNVRFTEEALAAAAIVHDDGNRYLNRRELELGAIDLQRGASENPAPNDHGNPSVDGPGPSEWPIE